MSKWNGTYRYVTLYLVPEYLAQGWEIAALLGPYSVLMRCPV